MILAVATFAVSVAFLVVLSKLTGIPLVPRRDRHEQPEAWRSFPTSQELVLDNLRTLYFEDSIDSAEFEARVWETLTGTAIEAEPGQRDEVFRLMRQARDRELEGSTIPLRWPVA